MNISRAKQIIDSPQEIEVHYQGAPVWIQHINEHDETARVYRRENPDDEQVVSISQLMEQ